MYRYQEEAYLLWLHKTPELGEKAARNLLADLGSAYKIYRADEETLIKSLTAGGWKEKVAKNKTERIAAFKAGWHVEREYEKLQQKRIKMVSFRDARYPARLKKLSDAPMILYYIGSLPKEEKCAVAIVGARECSGYGSYLAGAFGSKMGEWDIPVISGMARGIDGLSQEAALDAGGESFAVLGCGVDICYPKSNEPLYRKLQEKGGVLSPYPPGTEPKKNLFPYRNRIVAGLAEALLVIEARQKSGTLITVDMALEQGKDVYAVPGRLTDRLSDGCNTLLKQGAGIVLSPEDLAAELRILKNRSNPQQGKAQGVRLLEGRKMNGGSRIEPEEEKGSLLQYLDFSPRSTDEIYELIKNDRQDMTLPRLLFELIQLCLEGRAEQIGGNYFARSGK